jgi:hypothetical protein
MGYSGWGGVYRHFKDYSNGGQTDVIERMT